MSFNQWQIRDLFKKIKEVNQKNKEVEMLD